MIAKCSIDQEGREGKARLRLKQLHSSDRDWCHFVVFRNGLSPINIPIACGATVRAGDMRFHLYPTPNCAADTSGGVALQQSTGAGASLIGKSWGYYNKSIRVTGGCGGIFVLGRQTVPA